MDRHRSIMSDGAIAVHDGLIVAVGEREETCDAFEAERTIRLPGGVALPGLIDAHQHAGHGFVRTMGDDLDAWMETCRELYLHAATPDFWFAEARLTGLERLLAGSTTALTMLGGAGDTIRADDPSHAAAHLDGVGSLGLRSILAVGPGASDFPKVTTRHTQGASEPVSSTFAQQMATLDAIISAYRDHPRLAAAATFPTVLPHDVNDEMRHHADVLRDAADAAGVRIVQDGHNGATVDATYELGLLGSTTVLSHAIDLEPRHIDEIAAAGAGIAHNPSAIFSQFGRCPVPELQDAGVTVGLGSDATAPDRSADMFRHLFQVTRYHRADRRDPSVIDAPTALAMATVDAARLLGADDRIGSLEVGKDADIVVIDADVPHLTPLTHPIHQVVYFATGADVHTVVVAGEVLMHDRSIDGHIDSAGILDEARTQRDAAFGRLARS